MQCNLPVSNKRDSKENSCIHFGSGLVYDICIPGYVQKLLHFPQFPLFIPWGKKVSMDFNQRSWNFSRCMQLHQSTFYLNSHIEWNFKWATIKFAFQTRPKKKTATLQSKIWDTKKLRKVPSKVLIKYFFNSNWNKCKNSFNVLSYF